MGPVPISGGNVTQDIAPQHNQAHAPAGTVDDPAQSVDSRQPLQLRVDKVELTNEAQKDQLRSNDQHPEAMEQSADEPKRSASGIRFRILKDLSNRIQSRVVDRKTQEVIKSVPPDQLVHFYEKFRKVQERFAQEEQTA